MGVRKRSADNKKNSFELQKDWETPWGKIKKKGQFIEPTNDLKADLIKSGHIKPEEKKIESATKPEKSEKADQEKEVPNNK